MPGLDLGGDGHGCLGVAGRFTIDQMVVEEGRVVVLDAGFEVRCDGAAEAARGGVRVAGPPVGPLELGVATIGGMIDGGSGHAVVEGTATCTEAVLVRVSGNAVQPLLSDSGRRFCVAVHAAERTSTSAGHGVGDALRRTWKGGLERWNISLERAPGARSGAHRCGRHGPVIAYIVPGT
ncbi:hypothetical protein [Pseudonocardia humida]|uniref:Uncharacterized protein n=1 Tax=Pseudonocardia humida TaxID=2800819 RepID=A0ABT0ZWN4_9PSEU|nr:hypothetical protein [Pseudonocardia humida]MCO1655141.1 hypothetical protein [Pseudonocardia humida]